MKNDHAVKRPTVPSLAIHTRSRRLRRALQEVWRGLPSGDRATVASCMLRIRAEREWGAPEPIRPNKDNILNTHAAMLIWMGTGDGSVPERAAAIRFRLPVCRLFTYRALRGIVAHEFAHAIRAAQLGAAWARQLERHEGREQKAADRIATRWGFGREIRAMRDERRRTVNPAIAAHKRRILRDLNRQFQRNAAARARSGGEDDEEI